MDWADFFAKGSNFWGATRWLMCVADVFMFAEKNIRGLWI